MRLMPASTKTPSHHVVVIGDVHHLLWMAVDGLEQLELESGQPIDQVFSIGDLGLFLEESDWDYLTGPKKYRRPEDSNRIRKAWTRWRWPLTMIAGNHEPFHKLRNWDPHAFGEKLQYVHAGEMPHGVPGLRVAGLSGIVHPDELEFTNPTERKQHGLPKPQSWPAMVAECASGSVSRRRLAYYKQAELDSLSRLRPRPHLLMTHDWPEPPADITPPSKLRPEADLVRALEPTFHCCGHHHRFHRSKIGSTEVIALNIIADNPHRHTINSGWAFRFDWDGHALTGVGAWPPTE